MGAVAASWLAFRPQVQKEALLTETMPSLPQLLDPLRCHPGLLSSWLWRHGHAGARVAQGRQAGVSGGPCSPRASLSLCPPPGRVLLLHLLLAAAGGKSPSMRDSGREPPVAVATAGLPWGPAVSARWLHWLRGKSTVWGSVIRELIQPGWGRGDSWAALKAGAGTAVQRQPLCLLVVSGAGRGDRVQAEALGAAWGPALLVAPAGGQGEGGGGAQRCVTPPGAGRAERANSSSRYSSEPREAAQAGHYLTAYRYCRGPALVVFVTSYQIVNTVIFEGCFFPLERVVPPGGQEPP